MEFDIETWVPYSYDYKPITTNSLFSDALGRIAELAMRLDSEFLYMEAPDSCPVGTLVPENLIRPHVPSDAHSVRSQPPSLSGEQDDSDQESARRNDGQSGQRGFAMVFAYSRGMERVLYGMAGANDCFGVGITVCGIRKSAILMDECKVLVVASGSELFDADDFIDALGSALEDGNGAAGGNVPYFAEKFGYRRCAIPYETDDMTELLISNMLMTFEFDETRAIVGPMPEVSLDNF